MAHKNRIEDRSFCEKSMEVMVNIIKLSSLSLATLSLGEEHNKSGPASAIIRTFSNSSNSQLSKSKKSQAPSSESKMQTYLMERDAGDPTLSSSKIIDRRNQENHIKNDDGSFDDYIERFHKRNNQE
ncbi:hypothetical protein ABFS83_05G013000 [Erythranthe nasuta]